MQQSCQQRRPAASASTVGRHQPAAVPVVGSTSLASRARTLPSVACTGAQVTVVQPVTAT